MRHLAVFASGNGTNLQAIIDATESGHLQNTRVSVVLSDHKDAFALQRALRHAIPTIYHPYWPYREMGRERREYDADLARLLSVYPVDLVILAGWMRILSMSFLQHYPGRVLNIHPALPGAFPGTHAIERAYAAFRRGEIRETGVMVHYVPDEGVDNGPVIISERVPIYEDDTLDTLEARIHQVEHRIYIKAIARALERCD